MTEATLAKFDICRPVGGVEGATCGGDGLLDIFGRSIGGDTNDFFRGGVDIGIGSSACSLYELTIDVETFFMPKLGHWISPIAFPQSRFPRAPSFARFQFLPNTSV